MFVISNPFLIINRDTRTDCSFLLLVLKLQNVFKKSILLKITKNEIGSSTTCGCLRPIVANTVSRKSMIHLLSILHHKFEKIRFFGNLSYLTCPNLFSPGQRMFIFASICRTQSEATRHIKTRFVGKDFVKKKIILLKNDDFCKF